MKLLSLVGVVYLSAVLQSQSSLYTFSWNSGFANGGYIPDNNVNGWQDTRVISGFESGTLIHDLNVTLTLSGGYNGDLYGYLVQQNGGFVVLLNRIGTTSGNPSGYNNPGLNVIFDQQSSTDIHLHGTIAGVLTGTWQPDGRSANPATVLDTSIRDTSLNSFNFYDPNGTWTLYLQDRSFGDISQVLNWGLHMDAVLPEPTTIALYVCGAIACIGMFRRAMVRNAAK